MPDAIVFAATPFDFALAPGRTALVVIDMQRDFVEPGGFGASLGNDVTRLQAIPVIAALLAAWRARGWPVVHTREAHAPDLSDCPPAKRLRGAPTLRIGDTGPMGRLLVAGEPGSEIVAASRRSPARSSSTSRARACSGRPAARELQARGITHLVFTGVTTEVCVQTSMREANDRGYDSLLLEDCTESYFPEFKAATLAMIAAQGGDRRLACAVVEPAARADAATVAQGPKRRRRRDRRQTGFRCGSRRGAQISSIPVAVGARWPVESDSEKRSLVRV